MSSGSLPGKSTKSSLSRKTTSIGGVNAGGGAVVVIEKAVIRRSIGGGPSPAGEPEDAGNRECDNVDDAEEQVGKHEFEKEHGTQD